VGSVITRRGARRAKSVLRMMYSLRSLFASSRRMTLSLRCVNSRTLARSPSHASMSSIDGALFAARVARAGIVRARGVASVVECCARRVRGVSMMFCA